MFVIAKDLYSVEICCYYSRGYMVELCLHYSFCNAKHILIISWLAFSIDWIPRVQILGYLSMSLFWNMMLLLVINAKRICRLSMVLFRVHDVGQRYVWLWGNIWCLSKHKIMLICDAARVDAQNVAWDSNRVLHYVDVLVEGIVLSSKFPTKMVCGSDVNERKSIDSLVFHVREKSFI